METKHDAAPVEAGLAERLRNSRRHIDKFWSCVEKLSDDACWEWQGRKNKGYGSMSMFGKNVAPTEFL